MNSFCERERLGSEFIEQMKVLFSRGYSTKVIGEKLDLHKSTVHRRLQEAGVDLGGPGRKIQMTDEYVELARKLRYDGMTWREVSKKIGFSERQLQKRLNGK